MKAAKEFESTQERFKKQELEYSKKLEEMKMCNAKRKKTIQMSKVEKENYERLQKIPEDNKVQ